VCVRVRAFVYVHTSEVIVVFVCGGDVFVINQ
jgi:hypothetical protein